MSWKEATVMEQRWEFVMLALQEGANISLLCRRFDISRKTGYKWIHRAQTGEDDWFHNRPRRPHNTPNKIPEDVEKRILRIRDEHPAWGGRKIRVVLEKAGIQRPPSQPFHKNSKPFAT